MGKRMSTLPRIAGLIADATAVLKADNDRAEQAHRARAFDDGIGRISRVEAALMDPHTTAVANAYERALTVTQGARARLLTALTGEDSAAILRAIDAYAVTSIALWKAAELVCDTEDLPNNGESEGIAWRVPMLPDETREWNAGARIADDCFCRGCGARGYLTLCPRCQRDANGAGR